MITAIIALSIILIGIASIRFTDGCFKCGSRQKHPHEDFCNRCVEAINDYRGTAG